MRVVPFVVLALPPTLCLRLNRGMLTHDHWQVVTKVSKEQNTTVTVMGTTIDIKMRVFVCNSIEARAVGEYLAAQPDQQPSPFVVLCRQLSMAISYNSATLDPSQAAVADRLRKQAKTRAVKELREVYQRTLLRPGMSRVGNHRVSLHVIIGSPCI